MSLSICLAIACGDGHIGHWPLIRPLSESSVIVGSAHNTSIL